MWWQRILERRRRKRDTAGPDIAFWRLQSMFNNFRRILERNNAILETMANMDRALGGEYIFDRAYLEQSVRRISSDVHHVVYSLNALTSNRYVPLYDRYQDIRTILDDILAGDVRALAGAPVMPLHQVGWELEPLVGMEAVCMAELHNHTGIAVAPGCVLSTQGVDMLTGHVLPEELHPYGLADRALPLNRAGSPPSPSETAPGAEATGTNPPGSTASGSVTSILSSRSFTQDTLSPETLRKDVFLQLAGQLAVLLGENEAGKAAGASTKTTAGTVADTASGSRSVPLSGGLHVVISRIDAARDNMDCLPQEPCLAVCRLAPTAEGDAVWADVLTPHNHMPQMPCLTDMQNMAALADLAGAFQVAGTTARSYATLLEQILVAIRGILDAPASPQPDTPNSDMQTEDPSSAQCRLQPDARTLRMAVMVTRFHAPVVRGTVLSRVHAEQMPPMAETAISGHGMNSNLTDVIAITACALPLGSQTGTEDRYMLQRTYPFAPVQSEIAPRPAGTRFADGRLATSAVESGMTRGSALLRRHDMRGLAETAMALERMLGMPAMLEWELDEGGTCHIIRAIPHTVRATEADADLQSEALADELAKEIAHAVILARGGHMVQSGIAAGRVVHVTDDIRPENFPVGAVAVAQVASPRLTPILQRASAIICENGTIAGHLATVARELRIPAVFGIPDAFSRIPEGSDVTLDAAETIIYQGVLHHLLRFAMAGADLYPTDPEYRTLRRLLRFISPLHLVDPGAPEFSPQGCRSFHDLIHYCHERAVDELAHFQERRPGLGGIRTRRMQLGRPMDIRVLDIAGGLAENVSAEPRPEEVLSDPFAAFLEGLLRPEAWNTPAPALALRDIISSMPRSVNMLTASPDVLGENLAIVSRDYVNLSLRLGYHFSVVDAYLGADPQRNHVYFRFAGGLADPERRNRRARFIRDVLESMDFKVSLNEDLVVGSLKQVETCSMRDALFLLGALTAYSRQRDTSLYTDADMRTLFDIFHGNFLQHHCNVPQPHGIAVRMAQHAESRIKESGMENAAGGSPQ